MNEWLNEELKELERKKENKAADENKIALIQKQTEVVWRELKPFLKDAIDKMNADGSEFRKLTGGLAFDTPSDKTIEIGRRRGGAPFVVLDISCGPTSLSWRYIVSKTSNAQTGNERLPTTLEVDVKANGQPTLGKEGKFLNDEIESVVHQMLRPLIHTELLE